MKIKLLFKQFKSYSIVGLISLTIDAIVYVFLSDFLLFSKSSSKIISFIIASINSFYLNKIFTFEINVFNHKEPLKFILLYLISLIANSFTHDFFLNIIDGIWPFLIATLVSVIINFTGQKLWVFKN